MGKPTWLITVQSEFCAAHALRNYQGKCERLHGHNYALEIVVKGHTLSQDTELLLDFTVLKALIKDKLADFDHCLLNEISPFDTINPSAENIAQHIYRRMAAFLPEGVTMHAVKVSEKNIQSATYMEED